MKKKSRFLAKVNPKCLIVQCVGIVTKIRQRFADYVVSNCSLQKSD